MPIGRIKGSVTPVPAASTLLFRVDTVEYELEDSIRKPAGQTAQKRWNSPLMCTEVFDRSELCKNVLDLGLRKLLDSHSVRAERFDQSDRDLWITFDLNGHHRVY